jgi:predicted ATPase/transcriptional regulator with XRE-family HTH domain/Tfp pilus assembly protein PilF
MMIDASFGYWLRRRRKALDLTQDELGDRVGCSPATIRKIEADERRPSKQLAELLADQLQIPAAERANFLKAVRGEALVERLTPHPAPAALGHSPSSPLVEASIAPPPPAATKESQPRSNLPLPSTPFVGRASELAEITHLLTLPECRLLTITGSGGIGKSRLALAAAQAILDSSGDKGPKSKIKNPKFFDGIYFVSLAPLIAPEFMVSAIANSLGFSFSGSLDAKRQLLNYLRTKALLLVLDNLEHLLDGVDLLTEILQSAPAVKLLATSRERLNTQVEWVIDLQGLPTAPASQMENLDQYSAIALFVGRAQRARVGFAITAQNGPAIAHICRLVEGMPLAIELAAAWVHVLSCREIAQEIEHTLDFLAVSHRDVPARHRSLRAAFDHSWQLLTQQEQQALGQLSLFRGGFTRTAAQTVASASLPLLSSLVAKSLVRHTSNGRYDIHELMRQYAAIHLNEDATLAQATRERHGQFYLQLVVSQTDALKDSRQGEALATFDSEQDNIDQAWHWAVEQVQIDLIGQAVEGLGLFYLWRGRYREGGAACRLASEQLDTGIAASDPHTRALVQVLTWQGLFCRHLGQTERAGALLQQASALLGSLAGQAVDALHAPLALELGRLSTYTDRAVANRLIEQSLESYQRLGDEWGTANAYRELADVAWASGEHSPARQFATQSLQIRQAWQDARGIANVLDVLTLVVLDEGDLEEAERLIQQRIKLYRQVDDRAGLAGAYQTLAYVLLQSGDYEKSAGWFEENLALCVNLGDRQRISVAQNALGIFHCARGEYDKANKHAQISLAYAEEVFNRMGVADAHRTLGWVALGRGQFAKARHHLELSLHILRDLGQRHEMSWSLASLAYVELALGHPAQAQRSLVEVLRLATELTLSIPIMIALPAVALLLVAQGNCRRAVEIYALATNHYRFLRCSQWFEDIAGKQLAGIIATLPTEVVRPAQKRGKALDLATTIAELIRVWA